MLKRIKDQIEEIIEPIKASENLDKLQENFEAICARINEGLDKMRNSGVWLEGEMDNITDFANNRLAKLHENTANKPREEIRNSWAF